jgi:chromosome segregation ATPase
MNEEITIEMQLQAELSRLKKAIDYIDQAEKNVHQVKHLNEQYIYQHNDLIKSNKELSSIIDVNINDINNKIKHITHILNNNSDHISLQNMTILQFEEAIKNIRFEITNFDYAINVIKQDIEQLKILNSVIQKIELSVFRNNENANEQIRILKSEIFLLRNAVKQNEKEINLLKNNKWYDKLFRR